MKVLPVDIRNVELENFKLLVLGPKTDLYDNKEMTLEKLLNGRLMSI